MSDTDHGNPAPGGRESPVGEVAAWGRAAGAEDAVIHDSGPQGDGDNAAGAVGVAGAMGSLGEEARAVGVPEGSIFEEDSDIGPADEGEENVEQGPEVAVDAYQIPMVGFRFMFLNLVQALLHRLYHNNHILVRPRGIRRMVWPRQRRPRRMAQIHMLLVPEASGEGAAAMVPEGSAEGAPAPEPEAQAEAQEESAAGEMEEEAEEEPVLEAEAPEETTKYQYENFEEEAQDAESKEEQEEFNNKQEGPKKDEEPAESSLEE